MLPWMESLEPTSTSGAQRALALVPLLASIGRELQERSDALATLLVQREHRRRRNDPPGAVDAECATHRGELRRIHQELEGLGCRLVSLRARVFWAEAGQRGAERVFSWCTDEL